MRAAPPPLSDSLFCKNKIASFFSQKTELFLKDLNTRGLAPTTHRFLVLRVVWLRELCVRYWWGVLGDCVIFCVCALGHRAQF
jgi:hypothetical protein